MNALRLFFTPITFNEHKTVKQRFIEACDDFFYLRGKKIRVLQGTAEYIEDDLAVENVPMTALKIFGYGTLLIPIIMLVGKLLLRPELSFKQKQIIKTNSSRVKTAVLHPNHAQNAAPHVVFVDPTKKYLNDETIVNTLKKQIKDNDPFGTNSFCYIDSLVQSRTFARMKKLYHVFQTGNETKIAKLYNEGRTILIPVHVHKCHWGLLVANIDNKTLEYYDSLSASPPDDLVQSVRTHLQKVATHEQVELLGDDFSLKKQPCPQQETSYDCGIYLLLTAEHIIQNKPLTYTQEDVTLYRCQHFQG